jgi:hypothetical protein
MHAPTRSPGRRRAPSAGCSESACAAVSLQSVGVSAGASKSTWSAVQIRSVSCRWQSPSYTSSKSGGIGRSWFKREVAGAAEKD